MASGILKFDIATALVQTYKWLGVVGLRAENANEFIAEGTTLPGIPLLSVSPIEHQLADENSDVEK